MGNREGDMGGVCGRNGGLPRALPCVLHGTWEHPSILSLNMAHSAAAAATVWEVTAGRKGPERWWGLGDVGYRESSDLGQIDLKHSYTHTYTDPTWNNLFTSLSLILMSMK